MRTHSNVRIQTSQASQTGHAHVVPKATYRGKTKSLRVSMAKSEENCGQLAIIVILEGLKVQVDPAVEHLCQIKVHSDMPFQQLVCVPISP